MADVRDETLADKPHFRYVFAYEALLKWKESKQVSSFAEPVLLDYFRELSEKYKPTSLWSTYSMLKSMLNANHDINISEYSRLSAFLKEKAYGFQSKKSKEFTAEDVNKFVAEAPDDKYLAMKVALVFVVIGASSKDKIFNVKIDHVKDNGNEIIVRIPDPKTKVLKAHVIGGQFAEIVRKYMKVRPTTVSANRFLMQYRNGKCLNQVMSKRSIGKMAKEIAIFLKLPESEAYTGYCFRSTSTTVTADTGVAIDTVKRLGQQRCKMQVAEGYVQESSGQKTQIDRLIVEEPYFSSMSSDIIASHENPSEKIATDTKTRSELCSLGYDEISKDPLLLSQKLAATDMSDVSSSSENEESDASMAEVRDETLADKPRRYVFAYEALLKWQESKQVSSFAEPVLLDYFRELSEKYKPTSLWTTYSMLKSMLNAKNDINISEYSRLSAFLKEKAYGFESKKSKVFTAEDVNKFLNEAPDDEYLTMKVVLVFGVIASCSVESITSVDTDYVKDSGSEIIVRIPHRKSKIVRAYVIDGQFAEIVRKYMKLRPSTANTNRFLMLYRDGKCMKQAMGRHNIAKVPKEIAKFLKLPESEAYTRYSFRIISTTISADTGVRIETVKRHGQQRCSTVAEEKVQESFGLKRKIDSLIADEISLASTSNVIISSNENASKRITTDTVTSSASPSLGYEEISDAFTRPHLPVLPDVKENNLLFENEAPRRKKKKIPKRQKELCWYYDECLAQIKLTTQMFKRFSILGEEDKMKMLSEFSMHRVELFQKYFAAMNTVAINPINTPRTDASKNTLAPNSSMANPDFIIIKVNSLAKTNDVNEF